MFYMYLARRWPTWVKTYCFNKCRNFVVLTVISEIVIIRSHNRMFILKAYTMKWSQQLYIHNYMSTCTRGYVCVCEGKRNQAQVYITINFTFNHQPNVIKIIMLMNLQETFVKHERQRNIYYIFRTAPLHTRYIKNKRSF
jgi:hypothetical protein